MVISLGWLSPATSRGLPAARTTRAGSRCLLGLAPTGGYRAAPVARRAVGSYPTFSPLPLDKGRSVFCGPFRRLAAPRRYLAVCPVELGLSSARHSDRRTATITPYRLPRGKVSVSEGSGQASARQPSQQANQAVGRESSGSLRPRRLPGEPEAVVLLEHHAFQTRPVTGPQQRRRELDGVHAVQPPRPEQRQHVTRLSLGREQEERSVGQGEPLEQAEREPIGRRLGETESEVDIAPLPQHAVPERTGPLRDFVLEGPIVERQQTRFPERRVAGGVGQRVELGAAAAQLDQAASPRRVAELLAHAVATPARSGDRKSTR